jgi:hypothetical protein
VNRDATVTQGARGIDPVTVRRLQVLDVRVTSFDLQGNEGHEGDNVGQSRKNNAWQRRGNGAVKFLAVTPALP